MHSEGITDDYSVTINWITAMTNSTQLSHYTITLEWTQPVVFNQPSTLSDTETKIIPNNGQSFYTHTFRSIPPYSSNCLTVEAAYSHEDVVLDTVAAPTQCFTSPSSGIHTNNM